MNILAVAGTRPNFVKIAPLMRAMTHESSITSTLVHTGQHYDALMSDRFFLDMEIPRPDVNLGVGSGSQAWQTAQVLERIETVLVERRPDLVLVVGDVNSTLAAALAAVKLGIPIAHVEAGLRSFDRTMPEEINRVLTDAISDHLFVTEEDGRSNLLCEGIRPEKIHFVGNVMIDALEMFRERWQTSDIHAKLGVAGRPYALLTLHRPSNVDDPDRLSAFLAAMAELSRHLPVFFPVHPRVRARFSPPVGQGLACLDPLGYLDCLALMSRARLVLTDSGGIQEETTALGVPCLTLRDNTERPVTVTRGTNRVIGADPSRVLAEALRALEEPPRLVSRPVLWDGRAAARIIDHLLGRAGSVPEARVSLGAGGYGR